MSSFILLLFRAEALRFGSPVRAPMANSVCERFGGTLSRECLDFLIPLNERHLKMTVKEWGVHYNRDRPHSSLGSGYPVPNQESVPPSGHRVVKRRCWVA